MTAAPGSFSWTGSLPASRYTWKQIPGSSHDVLERRIRSLPPGLNALDLGFGAGFLARRIRDRCAYLAGIELDPEAAREGAPFFDRAIVGSILEELRAPWDVRFDLVIAGDVLEHVPDPAEPLALLRSLLSPGGLLLVSLPNVANVTVRLGLLFGRFPYRERGILDGTHLRFFTRASGRSLIESAGFRVERVTPTAMPVELALPALGRAPLAPLVRSLARALALLWPTLFGYQFVYEARSA